MNYKKQVQLLAIISTIWILFDIFFLCQPTGDDLICQKTPGEWILAPFLESIIILILCIPLFFTKEAVYLAWRKFALWFLSISALIIFSAPEYSGGGFIGMSYGFTREIMSMTLSVLFLLISLILITYKSIKLRGK
jgi:hypothetical protein